MSGREPSGSVAPRVSVIVAARDAAGTLGEALASVARQTYRRFEVIVADDGSVDGTGDVARTASLRVTVLRNDLPKGPAAARNMAAAAARGELLAVLDADDTFEPDYLESQIAAYDRAVAAGRDVGLVCCDAALVAPDGTRSRLWTDRVGRHDSVDLDRLLRANVVFGLVLMPRSAFVDVGGYDEDPRISAEDHDLWIRLLESGREIVVNPTVLATYRLRLDGRSTQVAAVAAGQRVMLARALDRGRLSRRQRWLARRQRRLFRLVQLRADASERPAPRRRALLLLPLTVLVAAENPQRWGHWLRSGPIAADAARHLER